MPDTKVSVTLGDMIDGGADLLPDGTLLVRFWLLARKGHNQPPAEVEAPNGTYRLVGKHETADGYVYQPVKEA